MVLLQKKEYLLTFHSPLRCASVVSTNFQPGKKKRRRNNQPLYCNNPVCVCLCLFLHYVLPSVVPLLLVDGACLDFVIVSLCNAAEPEREWALRTPQQYCDG